MAKKKSGKPFHWICPACLILLWQAFCSWGLIPADRLVSPLDVIRGLYELESEGLPPGYVLHLHVFYSLKLVAAGFLSALVLALPLGDTAFAFLRRALRRQNPLHADRGHIHHILLDSGMGQRKAVWLLYGVSALSGLLAVALSETGDTARAAAALTMTCAGGAACRLIRKRIARRRRSAS